MEKNYKKMRKLFLYILLFLSLLAGMIVFSPYGSQKGFSYKLIRHLVDINAPAKKVFNFLGNSNNASRWSSFVDHITLLNPQSFMDGTPGSIRRCFRNKNEHGMNGMN